MHSCIRKLKADYGREYWLTRLNQCWLHIKAKIRHANRGWPHFADSMKSSWGSAPDLAKFRLTLLYDGIWMGLWFRDFAKLEGYLSYSNELRVYCLQSSYLASVDRPPQCYQLQLNFAATTD